MKYLEMIAGAALFLMTWLLYFSQLAVVTWLLPVMLMIAGVVIFCDGSRRFLKKKR